MTRNRHTRDRSGRRDRAVAVAVALGFVLTFQIDRDTKRRAHGRL